MHMCTTPPFWMPRWETRPSVFVLGKGGAEGEENVGRPPSP